MLIGGFMAGRRIDDHSFWAGKGKEYPLPLGAKMKGVGSTEGAGDVKNYQDTNEKIVEAQNRGVSKIKSHPMKDGNRY